MSTPTVYLKIREMVDSGFLDEEDYVEFGENRLFLREEVNGEPPFSDEDINPKPSRVHELYEEYKTTEDQ